MANNKKQASETGTARDVVTVALKHPTGIVIEAFEKVKTQEPVLGGGFRDSVAYRSTGQQYPLHGNRVPFGKMPNYEIIGGYALTPNIPKEIWEVWKEQHHDSDLIKNNLITAYEKLDMSQDFAKEHETTRSGLEPLKHVGDPRVDKKRTREGKFVDAIVTADEQAVA